ncbi:MAG: methionine biosynthesis protein MetW [Deltaproteobacteria bacterium]|nr:methionine biosynthesis protein MetW [Deltaproteobacteria bacterium]
MLRVGRRAMVSFPNFGHVRFRLDLAIRDRRPVTPGWPYGWTRPISTCLFWPIFGGKLIRSKWPLV